MRQGSLIGPTIVAIGLVVAAVAFALVGAVMQTADGATELRVERMEAELTELRSELEVTQESLRRAQSDTRRILDDVARLAGSSPVAVTPTAPPPADEALGDHPVVEDMTEVMKLAKSRFNRGITQPNNRVMLDILGRPRTDLSQDCKGVTNEKLKALMETRQVGPIRVTMIQPALQSLERIFAKLRHQSPTFMPP